MNEKHAISDFQQNALVVIDEKFGEDGKIEKIDPHLVKIMGSYGNNISVKVCYPIYNRTIVWRVPVNTLVEEPSNSLMQKYSEHYGWDNNWWK